MRRIVYVLANLDEDGGQTVACTLLRNLDKNKYQSKLLVMSPHVENKLTETLRQSAVEIKFCDIALSTHMNRCYRFICMIKWLKKELDLFSPDIIHVHLDILYSWIVALVYKKKIIFTVHSEAKRIHNFASAYLFKRLQKKNLILVTGVSKISAEQFKNCFGAKDIKVIYNPVEVSHFKKENNDRKEKEVVFINVARFHPIKNHELLINAWKVLLEERKNIKLILVGDGEEYEKIKKMVDLMNLSSTIEFYGKVNDVAPILGKADVFVLSSSSEAFPVSVIEAIASGLPIVSTNVGGVSELVEDNGILVDPGNMQQLVVAMKELIDNDSERIRMGRLSEKYSEQFDVHKIIAQYEEIYNMV